MRKLEFKKKLRIFFLIFLSMRKYSIYPNGFVYFRESSLDEMRLPFENPRVTVNYSNLPRSQDYLAPGIEHGTPHTTFIAK